VEEAVGRRRLTPSQSIAYRLPYSPSVPAVVYQPPGPLSAIGQVGGPIIPGICADITGDYRLGFTILAILAGLGSGFFLLAKKPKRPLKEG
jgi:hypothetical protein